MSGRDPSAPARIARAASRTLCVLLLAAHAAAQNTPPVQPQNPILRRLVVEGSTVFSEQDILWLLDIEPGQPLPVTAARAAELLEQRYKGEGYTAASVTGELDAGSGRLQLRVDEGRVDAVEVRGVREAQRDRLQSLLTVVVGAPYNQRALDQTVRRLLAESMGAIEPDGEIKAEMRDGRRIAVVPLDQRRGAVHFDVGSDSREDVYSPVDGFSPALLFRAIRFDAERFKHTYIGGHVSYKFEREDVGYSLGIEQPLVANPRLWIGGEIHDLTASDDLWRLTGPEQSVAALGFKNTFRDYYRRHGGQAFVAVRPHADHEVVVAYRHDRHQALPNETNYSFFRDDHVFRPNLPIAGGELNALVFVYTFDTRGLADLDLNTTFTSHLSDDLFRNIRRQTFGARADWTSEISLDAGDYDFRRHILNARAFLPVTPRQTVAGRFMAGWSGAELPAERLFALGGIGSVHGHRFKEAVGESMALVNAEYGLTLLGSSSPEKTPLFRVLAFYDAGKIGKPLPGYSGDWLTGVGFGLQTGPFRVEFGYRTDRIPQSLQVLLRIAPTF